MTDLGATVRLSASNVNDQGELIPVGSGPTLTITLPDGTTDTSQTPVDDGVGLWHVDYVTTQAGRHVARWIGTGAGAFAFVEAFTVDPADVGFLFTLADAKRALGHPQKATSRDDQMREYIAAVTPIIEDIVGPILPRTVDEWLDGGAPQLPLSTTPVLTVTSLTEWAGTTGYPLTEQPYNVATVYDGYGYTINKQTGIVERTIGGYCGRFLYGVANVHAVYTAGQTLAPNVLLAAKEQFRFLWQYGQQSSHPGLGDDDTSVEYTPSGFAVPKRVIELCAGSRRLPVIA